MLTTIPWVHGLPSSDWTTAADPIGIYGNIGGVSLSFLCCLPMSLPCWLSSQSCPTGLQSRTGMMPQTCLLNSSVAGPSKPGPNGVVNIYNMAIFMSLLDSGHFLSVHLINLIKASTCRLLWRWYTDNITCSMLIALQNF